MSEAAERLRAARVAAGFKTTAEAARAFGWNYPTYAGHENGSRGLTRDNVRRYAKHFRVSPEWLLYGTGEATRKPVPLVGFIGAGAEVFPFDDGGSLEEIEAPPGCGPNAVAVKVTGESMMPRYLIGDVLIYEEHTSLREADGEECVVALTDGRVFVKTVHMEGGGLVTLESWNYPLMRNMEPKWVAPIKWIKRGRRPRPSELK